MEDGLLRSGAEGVQLTWMDAKVGDWVVTPRTGKAVEIQALWYNALCHLEKIAARLGDQSTSDYSRNLAERANSSFNQKFWNEASDCLFDVLHDDETTNAAIRPNQIFAVSLPYSMLQPERARSVVHIVERELLTPYGLRSLAPSHPDYRGRYEGDSLSRDGAYHQGTVWAWLIGPFITAYLKVHGRTPENIQQAREWLRAFREHLSDAGLGQVSEIFDGDPPHTPRGCIAQAWSVAELLRCEVEEL
jgi:predicted glycogen debranching enzyme